MGRSIRDIRKYERKNRPPEPGTAILVRLQAEPLERLDDWAAQQQDKPSRPEAIRRLIDLGLSAHSARISRIVAAGDARSRSEAAETARAAGAPASKVPAGSKADSGRKKRKQRS
jgi:hypothetical protein